jgi:NTE family protein
LLALEQDLGWDPRTAQVILGTSAGSVIGALLRTGLSVDDLASWGSGVRPRPGGEQFRHLLDHSAALPMPLRVSPVQLLPRPGVLGNFVRGRCKLSAAVSAMLPFGFIDAERALRHLGSLVDGWPDDELWISAVQLDDGRRVVFGRDERPELGTAVAASCAIPGLYRPVLVGGRLCVDGGAHSPTNADLLHDAGVDVVIVLSPMSAIASAAAGPAHWLRRRFAAVLRAECDVLHQAGIEVHVFEPDNATVDRMGFNSTDRSRISRVLTHAFLATGPQIAPSLRRRLGTRAGTIGDPDGRAA